MASAILRSRSSCGGGQDGNPGLSEPRQGGKLRTGRRHAIRARREPRAHWGPHAPPTVRKIRVEKGRAGHIHRFARRGEGACAVIAVDSPTPGPDRGQGLPSNDLASQNRRQGTPRRRDRGGDRSGGRDLLLNGPRRPGPQPTAGACAKRHIPPDRVRCGVRRAPTAVPRPGDGEGAPKSTLSPGQSRTERTGGVGITLGVARTARALALACTRTEARLITTARVGAAIIVIFEGSERGCGGTVKLYVRGVLASPGDRGARKTVLLWHTETDSQSWSQSDQLDFLAPHSVQSCALDSWLLLGAPHAPRLVLPLRPDERSVVLQGSRQQTKGGPATHCGSLRGLPCALDELHNALGRGLRVVFLRQVPDLGIQGLALRGQQGGRMLGRALILRGMSPRELHPP